MAFSALAIGFYLLKLQSLTICDKHFQNIVSTTLKERHA